MKKYLKELITHPLFSGSSIMIVGSNSASVLNYLYHLIIGRLLGPALYGELASLISVIGLLGIIPGVVSLVIVKEISSARNEVEVTKLIGWFKEKMFIVSLFFSVFVLIISPFISSFLNINKAVYLILVSIFYLFSLQSGFNRAILQGILRFKEMIISILAENGMKLVLSILLIYIGLQVEGAMLALLISGMFGLSITASFLKRYKYKETKISGNIESMLKFTIPVALQTIAITSLYTTDVILVKHFFPSHDAGIYAALSTLGKIIFFAAGPIGSVMFPLVSQRKARGEDFRKIFTYCFIITGIFTSISLIIYLLFPGVIINLLFGSAFTQAEKLLVWFGLFISLFTLSSLIITYNLSLGKTKVTILPFIAAIAQIIMIVLLHQTLFTVIMNSIVVTALLLLSLLIYSTYEARVSK